MKRLFTNDIAKVVVVFLILLSQTIAVAEDKKPSALYHALGSKVVTNLRPSPGANFGGYLQARVEVMVRSEEDLATIQLHAPYLRNDLIMLFSSKTRDQLLRAGGQQNMRRQALTILRKRIRKENKKTKIVKVLFTQVIIE